MTGLGLGLGLDVTVTATDRLWPRRDSVQIGNLTNLKLRVTVKPDLALGRGPGHHDQRRKPQDVQVQVIL